MSAVAAAVAADGVLPLVVFGRADLRVVGLLGSGLNWLRLRSGILETRLR